MSEIQETGLLEAAYNDLEKVKEAIRTYHFNLDMRNHGGAAAAQALEEIQKVLDMPWVQGDELRRRSSVKPEGKK